MRFDTVTFRRFLTAHLEKNRVPGAAVCIAGEEGTLFAEGFGFCNKALNQPVNTDTIFGIASMSKSFTCLAISLLEYEGKLSWDDPVIRYIPGFDLAGTPREAVQLRHLAEHNSGMPLLPTLSWSLAWNTEVEEWTREKMLKNRETAGSKVQTLEDILEYIKSGPIEVLGPPGRYTSYSNDSYAILSSVVDVVAGEPLEDFVRRRIFEPLGMRRSTFDTDAAKAMGNITSLFTREGENLYCSDNWDVAPPFRGCGWIKSTAADLSRYYLALSRMGMSGDKQVIPASCIERMVGPRYGLVPEGIYTLGFFKRSFGDNIVCDHSGGLTGVSSKGGFFYGKGFAGVILTNMSDVEVSSVLDAAFNLAVGAPLDYNRNQARPTGGQPSNPALYAGKYISHEGFDEPLQVSLDDKGELCISNGQASEALQFCGGNLFIPSGSGAVLSATTTLRFHVWQGVCPMVNVNSRIYQRAK